MASISQDSTDKDKANLLSEPWCKSLDNAKIICKTFVGTTKSELQKQNVLDDYCRSLPCDFVKSHPSNLKRKRSRKCATSRFLWQMKHIPYDGTPFCVASHDILKCTFSMNYNTKKKMKVEDINGEKDNDDKELNSSHSLCPAKITVKKLIRYPSFSVSLKALKKEKLQKLKELKGLLNRKQKVQKEELYWLCIPHSSYHNHEFRGKDRSVNKDIIEFIKQMVSKGICNPKKLQALISSHVMEKYATCNNPPSMEDEAYYPSEQSIRFIVYNFKNRKKKSSPNDECSKISEINMESNGASSSENSEEEKASSWKPSSLQDVVEAFCTDPIEEEVLDCNVTPEVLSMREKISFEIERIINLVNTSDNINNLEYILNCLQNLDNTYGDSFIGALGAINDCISVNDQNYAVIPYQFTNT